MGLTHALERQGHEVIPYLLDKRIDSMQAWLTYQWKRAGKPEPKPTAADVLYLAGTPIFERALRTLPDWVLVISAMYVHPDVLIMLKRLGVPVAYVFTESPYDLEQELKVAHYAHVVFTNERSCVDAFREVNEHSYYLPHAYDPERHFPVISEKVPAHDVVFVGTGFQERIDLLSAVDWTGIDLGLYGTWNLLGSRSRLRQYVRSTEPIPNSLAQQLYCRAKIGLNLYRTSKGFGRAAERIDHAESLNPRAYELAACGVYQMCDERAEGYEIFGGAVETIVSPEMLESQIRASLLLESDQYRQNMAEVARGTVRPHTFDARASLLIETLNRVARDRALRIVSRDGIGPRAEVMA